MSLHLPTPLINLITSGSTTSQTTSTSKEFADVLQLISAAVEARVDLVQVREKGLKTHVLFELTNRAAEITRGTSTKLLVNDRADVAKAAGADGVHLTTQSLPGDVVRHTFGKRFLIGVSTHSEEEVFSARDAGADFVVFGPVFETQSKLLYGAPRGLHELENIAKAAAAFPVVALGGVTIDNAQECVNAGASGVAAIRMFSDAQTLPGTVARLREQMK